MLKNGWGSTPNFFPSLLNISSPPPQLPHPNKTLLLIKNRKTIYIKTTNKLIYRNKIWGKEMNKKPHQIIFTILILTLLTNQVIAQINTQKNMTTPLNQPTEEWINERRFLYQQPSTPADEQGYPVLFLLHGGFQKAESWFDNKMPINRQTKFASYALQKGYFIIAPDSIRPDTFGRKRWDYTENTYNDSLDLPFIQDIITWLNQTPQLTVNTSKLYSVGLSGGGMMNVQIGNYFQETFTALAVITGGNPNHLTLQPFSLPQYDTTSPQNFSQNFPPTLVIHGKHDRIVPLEFATHFHNEMKKNNIQTQLLIDQYGIHSWPAQDFNTLILNWFTYGYNATTQPLQPTHGPGGTNYTHQDVKKTSYGFGEQQYWIFEPATPSPETAPVIVLNHGWPWMFPRFYQAWIDHIVKQGNIVIYPRYQLGLYFGVLRYSQNAIKAVKNAITELQTGDHITPQLDNFAITGHSIGGGITAYMAARTEDEGLPIPKAIMPVQPKLPFDQKADLTKIADTTYMLVIVGENDFSVGNASAKEIFLSTTQIPLQNKDYIIQMSDYYGYPPLRAIHQDPACEYNNSILTIDAMDYYSTWKLFDALTDYAFYGINQHYCLGNTTEQRYMGQWSDGTPVQELMVTDNP